jgi:signal peptide peptidase SppA
MVNGFPFLAQRLFNVPLAIRPEKAEIVLAALAERLGVSRLVRADGRMVAFSGDDWGDDSGDRVELPGYDVVAGVGIIPIAGTLVQKCSSLRPSSGMTGYNAIRENLATALDDAAVRAIVLDIDSPGGEVAGLFDLVDAIYAARGEKPIWALANEVACSAAYAIASAADKIAMPRTGYAGSIGTICMHVDFSRALEKEGITVTLLQYGKRKADGHEALPLSDEARQFIQSSIDFAGELFVETVARNRNLAARAVKGQEAAVFCGADAVTAGLVDAVMAPDDALRALVASLPR